ncbi:MAG: sulfate reduction electron transfer complex DsrMKJOP subunit DsrJ [Polyangiaceae bacterium]|jgi:hypothetical protein|nr:sulfate reduction electron transfer complex DsrMKJOP subunit DsrJ [Polyangiaceae bacterium]
MHDAGKIILGLAVFAGLTAFPVWYNAAFGKGTYHVDITPPPGGETECVAQTASGYMRGEHMKILDDWRNTVVRDGKRTTVTVAGKPYDYSLSKTCLGCHSNKTEFCDRCHDAAGVKPMCWDCHVTPEEAK